MKFLIFILIYSCSQLERPAHNASIRAKKKHHLNAQTSKIQDTKEEFIQSDEPPLIDSYRRVMRFNEVKDRSYSCKAPNFETYSYAKNYKKNILSQKPNYAQPNFAGHFYILKSPLELDSDWFIYDCRNGQFLPFVMTASSIMISLDSKVIIKNPPDAKATKSNYDHTAFGLPEIYKLDAETKKIIQINNSIQ
jgi:hypothetical protein